MFTIYKIPEQFATLEQTNDYLYFCHSGSEQCDDGYTYGPAIRPFYLIHFVISGKGTFQTVDTLYHLTANQAFIIYPDEVTTYAADKHEPWHYCFFAFNGNLAPQLLERTDFRDGNRVVDLPKTSIVDIIKEVTIELNKPILNKDIYGLSQLFKILKIFTDLSGKTEHHEITPSKNYVKQAIDYIHYNYASPILVSHLADMLALNRCYFYRVFKNETGYSPMDYLNNYRIERAKELLFKSHMSIAEIATITGFNTFSSFYRMFLLKTTMSARQYRDTMSHLAIENKSESEESLLRP